MKLPEITYGSVPAIRSTDPRTAAVEFQQKQNILGQAMQAAQDISSTFREYQVTKADAAYADEMASFRQEAAQHNTLSPGQARALDIEVEGDEDVLKVEWYPRLLAKRMEEYRGKHAATIKSPIDRKRWLDSVSANDNKILAQEAEIAARETEAYKTQELLSTFQEAEAKGDLVTMQMVMDDSSFMRDSKSLAQRNQLQSKLNAAQERSEVESLETAVNATVNAGTDKELQSQLDSLLDPKKRAALPGGERTAQVLTNRLKAEKDRRMRNAITLEGVSLRDRNRAVKSQLADLEAARSSGMPVYDYQLDALEESASGTDYEEPISVMREALDYSTRDYATKEADKNAAQAKGLSGAQQYQAYVQEDIRVAKGIENQGYTFAVTNALGPAGFIPLDSPESYQARVDQVEFLSTSHYGTEQQPADIPVFGTAEVQGVKQMMEMSTPAERLGWASIFQNTPEVFGEFIDGGAPVMAVSIATGDEQTFIDADLGRQRMEGGHWKKPPQGEYMQAYRDHAGNLTAGVPATEAAYVETALSLYAAAAPEGDEGVFDSKAFESQLERIMPVSNINGVKTIIPFRTPEDAMQDYVDNFTSEQIVAMGGSEYKPERAARIARDGQWISQGAGKYHVVHGGIKLMDPKGFPMEFVFNEEIAERVMADKKSDQQSKRQSDVDIPSIPGF